MLRRVSTFLGLALLVTPCATARLAAQPASAANQRATLLPPVEAEPGPAPPAVVTAPPSSGSAPVCDTPAAWADAFRASAPGWSPQSWAEADYLLWWMQGSHLPPLVTTSPPGTPASSAGVLGTPGTTTLFGNSSANASARSGGRIFLGTWLNDAQTFGVEGNFLYLESKATNFSAASGGTPTLGRPFIDATTGTAVAQQIAFPGLLQGSVLASNATTGLLGAGVLARQALCCGCGWRLDYLAGYRFLRFADRLDVDETLTTLPGNAVVAPGTQLRVGDQFGTRNEFHGFDTGLAATLPVGPLQVRLLGKVALGSTYQVVDIAGATMTTVPGLAPASGAGGLLALPSNIGHYSRQRFSAIPELGAKVGGNLTPNVRFWLGYTWLYWTSVARAGDQVDLRVNPGLLPPAVSPLTGPALPGFLFQSHHFWAQGVDLGLEFRF